MSAHTPPLRFALLVAKGAASAWHVQCLDHLRRTATLSGLIRVPSRDAAEITGRRSIRLYGTRGATGQLVDLAASMTDVPVFDAADRDPISAARFDFALKLGSGSIPAGIARATRFGVWHFSHEMNHDSLPFLREVYEGNDVTYAALLSESGERSTTLLDGFFATDLRSYVASRDRVLASILEWPSRACQRMAAGQNPPERGPASAVARRSPGAPQVLRFGARIARRRLEFAAERLFRHRQWNIGIVHLPVARLLDLAEDIEDRIEWFPLTGRDAFLADPFALMRGDTPHVFCEYFTYRSEKGEIHSVDYVNGGFAGRLTPALRLPTHMSYPFLIEAGGEVYCIPETSRANEVALFRAVEFPNNWRKVSVILKEFPGVDPTVFHYDDRWWLMCTRAGREADVSLWVWYASSLFGPWTPHTLNPVKTDVRGARPGGAPFVVDGALYRPAQDCSRRYGWRIAIQRVHRLTPWEFSEELVRVVEPSANSRFPLGRHTLTPVGDMVLIDGHRTVFVWVAFQSFLRTWARDVASRLGRRARA